jgi:hypothetical protein
MSEEDRDKNGRQDDVEIQLPWAKVRASGRTIVNIIFMMAVGGLVFWHDWKSDLREIENIKRQDATIAAMHNITYILTLSDTERAALKLNMPADLRAMVIQSRGRTSE